MSKKVLSAASIFWIVFLSFTLVYAMLCGFGVTNTFWGWDAGQAGIGWTVFMLVLLAIAGMILWAWATGRIEGQKYTGAVVGVFVGLAFCASTGFKFTAGDIKQRITYLDNQGRVADTAVLFGCYENFYHFNDNPDLKKYVIQYGELPGRNRWNAFILAGELKKSTAPRADEDFQWHTGAYEMDLKNNGGCK